MRSKRTTQKILAPLLAMMLTPLLTACNLFVSKEDQCLASSRLSFGDPDSLKVVQNLGERGKKDWLVGEGFWLRYSNANEVGGRVSGTMACEKIDGKWMRSRRLEERAKQEVFTALQIQELAVELDLINKINADRKACKTQQCRDEHNAKFSHLAMDPAGEMAIARANKRAQELTYEKVYQDIADF
jgi:hypothetical protein